MTRILISDDNVTIRELLVSYFLREGYIVDQARDGLETLEYANNNHYDIILLDVMMPHMDGFEVCQTIRETSNVPIIMITARGEDYDRIMGLDIGADDYIVKPFLLDEVHARVKAILRRIAPTSQNLLRLSDLMINLDDFLVTIKNEPVSLTKKEIEILWTLAKHPNQVFTRDHLLDSVWGIDYFGDSRTVDAHIKRLRSKLSKHNHDTSWNVATVWGVGYKFEVSAHEV